MKTEVFKVKDGWGVAIILRLFDQRIESPRTYTTHYGARMAAQDWVDRIERGEAELWGPSILLEMTSPMPDLRPLYDYVKKQIDKSIMTMEVWG